jgi:hypothetical protein
MTQAHAGAGVSTGRFRQFKLAAGVTDRSGTTR